MWASRTPRLYFTSLHIRSHSDKLSEDKVTIYPTRRTPWHVVPSRALPPGLVRHRQVWQQGAGMLQKRGQGPSWSLYGMSKEI